MRRGHRRANTTATRVPIDCDPLPVYGEGRVCAYRGCITRLRRTHPGDFCSLHEPEAPLMPPAYQEVFDLLADGEYHARMEGLSDDAWNGRIKFVREYVEGSYVITYTKGKGYILTEVR